MKIVIRNIKIIRTSINIQIFTMYGELRRFQNCAIMRHSGCRAWLENIFYWICTTIRYALLELSLCSKIAEHGICNIAWLQGIHDCAAWL